MTHELTYTYTPLTVAIHVEGQSPVVGDITISLQEGNVARDAVIVVRSDISGTDISFSINELAQLYPAALHLLSGVKDGSSR